MRCIFRKRTPEQGTTLLEVLIAIVVFSFGMIGMLGLVVNSLKMTSTSNYRSFASEQLAAMAEALNANPAVIDKYLSGSSTAVATCLTATGCSTTDLAATEIKLWKERIETPPNGLPSGSAVICRDSTLASAACDGSGRPVVKICWNESRVSTDSTWSTACLINEL